MGAINRRLYILFAVNKLIIIILLVLPLGIQKRGEAVSSEKSFRHRIGRRKYSLVSARSQSVRLHG